MKKSSCKATASEIFRTLNKSTEQRVQEKLYRLYIDERCLFFWLNPGACAYYNIAENAENLYVVFY